MKLTVNSLRRSVRVPLAARARVSWKAMITECIGLVLLFDPSRLVFAGSSTNDLTGPWQLLVDDFPVASKSNVVRTYHPFEKYPNNPVLVVDRPWEGLVYLYGTVLRDESGTGYRMWYHTLRTNSACSDGSLELYATSTNGIHWVKPILNLRTGCGSTSNNMYFTRPTAGGMTSVMHMPWETDPAQRYKFMNYDSGGFWAAWSPDGIHVTDAPNNPVFTGGSDVGQFTWDPHTQRYLGYVKNAWYDWNGLKRRAVALTTTTNITTWPRESLILWPDAYDDRWAMPGTVQRTHFYGLSAFPYESMYIGLLWIFRATELDGEMPGYLIGPCFVELVSSHDGVNWTREEADRPPILPLGPTNSWDDGMVFTARAPVCDGDTLKLWYGGFDQVHGTALTKTIGSIGLATLRKDGFASLDAGESVGTVLTRILIGVGGQLHANYQTTNGGWLKVEVLDEQNNVLPGYSQTNCIALTGDSVSQAVTWAAHTELPEEPPRLRLRFVLQNASVYSFMAGESVTVVAPPLLTQQPTNQAVAPGSAANFTIVASGSSPLSYQWQKNYLDLGNGGHYAGCTTPTLTISSVDASDMASYRCVVANVYGRTNSNPVTLLLRPSCPPVALLNGNFEGSYSSGIGTNWIGYQRAPYPTTVWSIQFASPPAGGGLQYQQIANTSSTGGGGVRQTVTGCVVGAVYTISGWMRGNSAKATCTVKCSPSASTDWATAIDLNPPQTCSTNNWVPFSGTVRATGTNMTIWLDGQTGGTGLNKAACFDAVTVTCTAAPLPLHFESVTLEGTQQTRLVLSGEPGQSVTIQRSSNLVNWFLVTNLVNTDGMLQYTDRPTSNAKRRFYRATSP